MNPVPELTEERRMAALKLAMRARRDRAEFKRALKRGRIAPGKAIGARAAQRMSAYDFIRSFPGIGNATATAIMQRVGISRNRRVRGLGCRQKRELLHELEWGMK